MSEQALHGLSVLEYGNGVSAAYAGKLMADLGAEVIKIESPEVGDSARHRAPFAQDKPGLDRSGLFAYLNTNKYSVTLDCEKPEGKQVFKQLVEKSDILIENNSPQFMKGLGLTYPELEAINPQLVMVSITPFGQTGPHSLYKAFELTTYNSCGYGMATTACIEEPVMPPVKAGGSQSEFAGGQAAAAAAMTAIFARDHMGAGQHIDLSIQELMAHQYEAAIQHWTFDENEIGGVSAPVMHPIMPLECSDGWIFLMCVEDFQFDRLVEVMGNPEWASEELFVDRFVRAEYIDALKIFLTEWSMQHSKEEVFHMCQAAKIPVGPAYSAQEVVESEHLKERKYFVEIDHPEIGPAVYPGGPYRFSQTPWKIDSAAPRLREHNQKILGESLGISEQELEAMRQTGTI